MNLIKTHEEKFVQAMLTFGLQSLGDALPFKELRDVQPHFRILKWRNSDGVFFSTNGCAGCTRNAKFKYEFIVHAGVPELAYLKLINLVSFFHVTRRDILPGTVLEIGGANDPVPGFSHAYFSVPYFLPPEVNAIVVGEFTFSLLWVFPLRRFEAEFITEHGVDAFEEKLEQFGTDFFADRGDGAYLNSSDT